MRGVRSVAVLGQSRAAIGRLRSHGRKCARSPANRGCVCVCVCHVSIVSIRSEAWRLRTEALSQTNPAWSLTLSSYVRILQDLLIHPTNGTSAIMRSCSAVRCRLRVRALPSFPRETERFN
ncbi:hypothetical protein COCON_G00228440 [Conger conger]|uniref:Uncharacterized protein n=1 Tax=Conger conger TaxID=82655 RepID=A0A9Q1CV09_CONCO|nr:hypothetical protein COCON_G00228440 [Conger conger]